MAQIWFDISFVEYSLWSLKSIVFKIHTCTQRDRWYRLTSFVMAKMQRRKALVPIRLYFLYLVLMRVRKKCHIPISQLLDFNIQLRSMSIWRDCVCHSYYYSHLPLSNVNYSFNMGVWNDVFCETQTCDYGKLKRLWTFQCKRLGKCFHIRAFRN